DVGKVDRPAAKLDGDALDRALDHRGRPNLARLRIDLEQPPSGFDFPRFRQLHGDDAGFAPHDAATADAGVKNCVMPPHNATPTRGHHNIPVTGRTWNLKIRLRAGRPRPNGCAGWGAPSTYRGLASFQLDWREGGKKALFGITRLYTLLRHPRRA